MNEDEMEIRVSEVVAGLFLFCQGGDEQFERKFFRFKDF